MSGVPGKDYIPDCEDVKVRCPTPDERSRKACLITHPATRNTNVAFIPHSSFMEAILLISLDVKNGIILIEYIGQHREQ
jgi:hypothetical protein